MDDHIKKCNHPNCKHVWSGPWGTFIGIHSYIKITIKGGKDGAKYFDFTDCPLGKKINLSVGWDY